MKPYILQLSTDVVKAGCFAPALLIKKLFKNTNSSKTSNFRLIVYFIVEHKLSMKFANRQKLHSFSRFLPKNSRKSPIFCRGLLVRIQLPQPS